MASGVIVADAGPLIALAIGEVLPATVTMMGGLIVPQPVLDECIADITAAGAAAIQRLTQSATLMIIAHSDIAPLDEAYARGLGSGEAAVLSYAHAHNHTALIDERRARRLAVKMRVPVIGTGAVLLALKAQDFIASVTPVLTAWQSHGYYLSEAITEQILHRAGESLPTR